MVDHNAWSTEHPPVDMETVRTVEKSLGIRFPSKYIHFIKMYHGAEPVRRSLDINGKEAMFASFLTFTPFDELDILDTYNEQKNNLPPNHFPFAIDVEGNLFCFNYVHNSPPIIIYIEMIDSITNPLVSHVVATDFTEFIQQFNEST